MNTLPARAALAWLCLAAAALAIPQTLNNNGFLANNAVLFENFAVDPAAWAVDAKLKGEWSEPDAAGRQTLKDSAVVFGLPAAQIVAERSAGRVVAIRVVFRDPTDSAKHTPLLERVAQNIRSFTGEAGKGDKAARIFQHRAKRITARTTAAGEVVVEFTPGE